MEGKGIPSSQDGLSEEEEWWKQGKGKEKARPTFQEAEEQEMGGQEWRQGKRKREPEKDKEDTAGEDMVTAPLGPSPPGPSAAFSSHKEMAAVHQGPGSPCGRILRRPDLASGVPKLHRV